MERRKVNLNLRLRIMNLPSLKIRRKIGDMVEVYKHLNVYDKSSLCQKFVLCNRPQHLSTLSNERGILPKMALEDNKEIHSYYRSIITRSSTGTNHRKKTKECTANFWVDSRWKSHFLHPFLNREKLQSLLPDNF